MTEFEARKAYMTAKHEYDIARAEWVRASNAGMKWGAKSIDAYKADMDSKLKVAVAAKKVLDSVAEPYIEKD